MLIKLDNIKKYYKTKDGVKKALKGVSVDIEVGEFITISGPSGSGKTTLISILALLMPQTKGKYYYTKKKIKASNEKRKAQIRRRHIGFIFQEGLLLPGLTVYENCALPLMYSRVSEKEVKKRCQQALDKVGLGDYMYKKPNQLSGGQQQRVAIARALMNRPKLIIADEPCAALDPETRLDVLKIFQDLNADGVTILMVSHSKQDAQFSKRIIRIEDGFLTDDRSVVRPEISARHTQTTVDVVEKKNTNEIIKPSGEGIKPDEEQFFQLLEIHSISKNIKGISETLQFVYQIKDLESLILSLKVLSYKDYYHQNAEEIVKLSYAFLKHSSWKVRLLAQRILSNNISKVKEADYSELQNALVSLLADKNPMVREEAYLLVSENNTLIDNQFVKSCVKQGAADTSSQIRSICAGLLPLLESKYMLSAVSKYIEDPNFRVVSNTIESMWNLFNTDESRFDEKLVKEILSKLPLHENNRLKANVALIFFHIDKEFSEKITLELLNHENPSYIASGIYVAKIHFPDMLKQMLPKLLNLPYKRVHDILKKSGPEKIAA